MSDYLQRSGSARLIPEIYQRMIRVIHEGVDTEVVRPAADAVFRLSSGRSVRREDEVVTFVARNLEPLRGYHIFMRSLPKILRERPRAQILVIGEDRTYYGASPPAGKTWKSIFLNEVRDRIDSKRVHFTGRLAYRDYLKALQVSSAHVYLTYPFVLSWSCIEALSCGCVVIGSDTTPVREVINGENGVLVPFFDHEQLANRGNRGAGAAAPIPIDARGSSTHCGGAIRSANHFFAADDGSAPRGRNTAAGTKASEITPDSEARVAAAQAATPSSNRKVKLDCGRPTPASPLTPAPAHRVQVRGRRANAASLFQRLLASAKDRAGSCADGSLRVGYARS